MDQEYEQEQEQEYEQEQEQEQVIYNVKPDKKESDSLVYFLIGICLMGGGAAPNCWFFGIIGIMFIVASLFEQE